MLDDRIISIDNINDMQVDSGYSLEKSKDGKNIVKINYEKQKCYIGSKYNTERDIKAFLNKIPIYNIETQFIVFGLGGGEHIISLLNILGKDNSVLVLEPDKNIIKLFKSADTTSCIANDKRVGIFYCNDSVEDLLKIYLNHKKMDNIIMLNYSNYKAIYKKKYDKIKEILNKHQFDMIINLKTLNTFDNFIFNNYVHNFKYIVQSTKIDCFKEKFKGKSAIVVSAGPSLEKNIHYLKEAQDKFIIISGARTLKTLNSIGISPDFVMLLDPQDYNERFFKNMEESSAPLFFSGISNYKAVEAYKGKKIYLQIGNLESYSEKILRNKIPNLYVKGTIAHLCTSFAKYIGCSAIIFIGQDFAYTDNKFHSDVSAYDENGNIVNSPNIDKSIEGALYVQDINGDQVLSDRRFLYYKEGMEEYIKSVPSVKFINSTEGGAHIKGTEIFSLKESIELYGKHIDKNLDNIFKETYGNIDYKNELRDIANSYTSIIELCNEGLNYIKEIEKYNIVDQNKKIKKAIIKIYAINEKIQTEESLEFIKGLTIEIFNNTIHNKKYIPNDEEPVIDTINKIVESGKLFYTNMIDILNYGVKIIVDEIN